MKFSEKKYCEDNYCFWARVSGPDGDFNENDFHVDYETAKDHCRLACKYLPPGPFGILMEMKELGWKFEFFGLPEHYFEVALG